MDALFENKVSWACRIFSRLCNRHHQIRPFLKHRKTEIGNGENFDPKENQKERKIFIFRESCLTSTKTSLTFSSNLDQILPSFDEW